MLGSRCLAFSTSSSTERWPVCEKNVSTIRSRCRVDFSPRAAIQLARRSWAAVEIFFGAVRFILKLILTLENSTGRRAGRQGRPDSAQPAALPAQLPPGLGLLPAAAPAEPHQPRIRPLPARASAVVAPTAHPRPLRR